MSSANVIPSAPPGDENFYSAPAPQSTQLYPNIPATINTENFRLTEISKIEKEIAGEVEHYRLVLKKYKKVRKVIHYSVVCLGAATAALSSGAVVTSITGIGVLVRAPVAAIAALSSAASTGLSVINKKLERKVNKLSKIHALAVAKHDSINSFVSQALDDNKVSDNEFKLIAREMQKYRQLKESLRSDFASKPRKKQSEPASGDLEKLKQDVRTEVREEYRKK